LQRWKLSFARWRNYDLYEATGIGDDAGPHEEWRVYFDFKRDILMGQLYFSFHRGWLSDPEGDMERLRHIVVGAETLTSSELALQPGTSGDSQEQIAGVV
jgi:hypothetical protein